MFFKHSVFVFLFIFIIYNSYSLDQDGDIQASGSVLTEKEIESYFRGEYTRGYNFLFELSAIGTIELINTVKFKSGIAVGRTIRDTSLDIFVNIDYFPFKKLPIIFSLTYFFNGYPEYKAYLNSLFPFVSYKAKWAGVSVGVNFRFSSYFSEIAQFESILTFYGYVNFINNNKMLLGIGCGNFNDFNARNLGGLSLNLYSEIKLNAKIKLCNDIEYMQSGMDGLTATLYKFAYRTGVKYSW